MVDERLVAAVHVIAPDVPHEAVRLQADGSFVGEVQLRLPPTGQVRVILYDSDERPQQTLEHI